MDKPNPTSQVRMSREIHKHAEENIAYIYIYKTKYENVPLEEGVP